MKTDLFTEDPAERIAQLEKQNAELLATIRQMVGAWYRIRPHVHALAGAVEEVGQTQSDAQILLQKMEVS